MRHSSSSTVAYHYSLLRPLAQATKGQSHLLRLSQQNDFIAVIRKYFIFVQLVLANLLTLAHDVTLLLDSGVLADEQFNERTQQRFTSLADVVEQNALRADSGNVRGVLRDQLVVRLRRRCRV